MILIVVDDHPTVRKGIISIVSSNNNEYKILEAATQLEAEKIIEATNPDMALIDLKLGRNQSGIGLIKNMKKLNLKTKFIILTGGLMSSDFEEAEKLNVDGYIMKDAVSEDINYAINLIARGQKYYSPTVMNYYKRSKKNTQLDILTNRESEVIERVVKGMTNEKIAKELFISENTVKKHISSILTKLELDNRSQVAYFLSNIKKSSFEEIYDENKII
ncbi:MAG: response regulator transcription factor [Clostridiales bacterium]